MTPFTRSMIIVGRLVPVLDQAVTGHDPGLGHPHPEPETEPGPVTSWTEVAAVLGISVDTVARRRASFDPHRAPWFASAAEVHAWFAGLRRPPARPRKGRKSTRATPTGEASF